MASYEEASAICSTDAHCSDRGSCTHGSCVCDPGWYGLACGAQSCAGPITDHGTNLSWTAAAIRGSFVSQDITLPVVSNAHCTWSLDPSSSPVVTSPDVPARVGMRVVIERFNLEWRVPNEDYLQIIWDEDVSEPIVLRADACTSRADCFQWYHAQPPTCEDGECQVRRVFEAASSRANVVLRTDKNDRGLLFSGVAGSWYTLHECPARSDRCRDANGVCSNGACFRDNLAINCSCALDTCARGYLLQTLEGGDTRCAACPAGKYEFDGTECKSAESSHYIPVAGTFALDARSDPIGQQDCPPNAAVQTRLLEPTEYCSSGQQDCISYPIVWQTIQGGANLGECQCSPGHYYKLPQQNTAPSPPSAPPSASPPPQSPVDCPCIHSYPEGTLGRAANGLLIFPALIAGLQYPYDPQYGLFNCSAHDKGWAPFCNETDSPGWCSDNWCFVNASACNTATYLSSYRPDAGLRYSYEACSATNAFLADYELVSDAGQTLGDDGCTPCPSGARCLGGYIQPLAKP